MAELLVKAMDSTHADSVKDMRGCYKTGMPVVVMEDGHIWGGEECLPRFVVIKIPTISVDVVKKYIEPEYQGVDNQGRPEMYRRRKWNISWVDLPSAVKTKILANGGLTIKAGTYTGAYDYTWAQVKNYFKQITSGSSETMII